jgi:hypothetical protein
VFLLSKELSCPYKNARHRIFWAGLQTLLIRVTSSLHSWFYLLKHLRDTCFVTGKKGLLEGGEDHGISRGARATGKILLLSWSLDWHQATMVGGMRVGTELLFKRSY